MPMYPAQCYISPHSVKSAMSFEHLRDLTEPQYEMDRIFWKVRPWLNLLKSYGMKGELTMPGAKQNRGGFDWTFVNISLTKADEKQFAAFFSEYETRVIETLQNVMADGYKLSLSYDFDNQCFIATFSGTKNTTYNQGCSISARSAEAAEAIMLLCFKHVVLCQAGQWSDYARPSNWG